MSRQQDRFGSRLRHYREAAGFSQETLAERAGLSANAISALERGERKRPYPETIRRLADALGLDQTAREELVGAIRASRPEALAPGPERASIPSLPELPGEPTPLIGREREVDVVRHLLAQPGARLLTLTGPGGVGKTRLALHVARAATELFPDGVIWVELAPLSGPDLVLAAISRTLELEEARKDHLRQALYACLRDRTSLLVLDNFEHVLDAAPEIASLLQACPHLTILVTSRASLNIRAEQEYVVPPLELPVPGTREDASTVADIPSIQLFVWQVQQKDPSFELNDDNSAAVAAVCRRLDGVPLALELAAARVKLLGIPSLLSRLDRALPLLIGGSRDLPARQRTMEAAVAWSYDLLKPDEQALFRRLSVFAGGWTLEAAEMVANAPGPLSLDVLQGMAVLLDHSLIRQLGEHEGMRRFGMLETLRQFGLQRMDDHGEIDAIQRAHLEWYMALAETAEKSLAGSQQVAWLTQLETELDNVRAALNSRIDNAQEAQLRLAGALWRFWWWHGHFSEGRFWLTQILSRSSSSPSRWRGKALTAAAILAREQGDMQHAIALLEEGLAIRREIGDERDIAQSLNILGLLASDRSRFTEAQSCHEEALSLYRRAGDQVGIANVLNNLAIVAQEQMEFSRAAELGQESLILFRDVGDLRGECTALHNLGRVARNMGDLPGATRYYEQSMAIRRQLGDKVGIAMTLHNLGRVAMDLGAIGRAIELYEESLAIRREAGDKVGCVKMFEDVAVLALKTGHARDAARLLCAASAWRTALDVPLPPIDRARLDPIIEASRNALEDDDYDEASASGSALSIDKAVEESLHVLQRARIEHDSSG